MRFAGRQSWRVRFDAGSLMLHAALYVRQACAVPDDGSPPPLLVAPPRAAPRVDPAEWQAWWTSLVAADQDALASPAQRWPLASGALSRFLDALGDEPFRWVCREVRDADRYREPGYSLPVRESVRRLEREHGRRSLMDVRIEALAVRGDWVEVAGDGSTVLTSWAALDHPDDWLTDSLRPAFRRG